MASCECPDAWLNGHREGCRFFGTDRIDRGAGNDRISGASGDQCGHGVQRSLYGYYSPYPAGWQEAKARVDEAQPSPSGRCEKVDDWSLSRCRACGGVPCLEANSATDEWVSCSQCGVRTAGRQTTTQAIMLIRLLPTGARC